MRRMFIGAFGALLLSASLAQGQASQSASAADGHRTVITARAVTLTVRDLDTTKWTFTALTGTVSAQETILLGNVVAEIDDARYMADRAVVRRGGEIRFEGNVRVERPARGGVTSGR